MFTLVRRNKDFRNFWYGQIVSQLGDRVHTLAVIWLVYSWSNSGSAVGFVLIASTLPAFLISPLAGSLLDKYDRKKIMIICDFLRSALVLILSILAFMNMLNLPIIVAFTAVISIGAAFFNPATMSIMPSLVKQEELTQANAFYQLSVNASGAFGFLLGSGLIALIGVPVAFLINGFSFLLSAYFIMKLAYKHVPVIRESHFWADFKEGWNVTKKIPLIIKLFTPIIIINFFLSALYILIPVFAEGVFNRGSSGLGMMMTGLTLGMFFGALIMLRNKLQISIRMLLFASLCLIGLAFMMMSFFEDFNFYLFAFAVIGVFLNISNIALMALFQKIVPNEVRGKVFGLLTSASVSSQPISYGVMGLLTDLVAPGTILLFCAVALTLTAFRFLTIKELKQV